MRSEEKHQGEHRLPGRRLQNCPSHMKGHACPWLADNRCPQTKCFIYFDMIHRFNAVGNAFPEPPTGLSDYLDSHYDKFQVTLIRDALKEAQNRLPPRTIDLNLNGLIQHFSFWLNDKGEK